MRVEQLLGIDGIARCQDLRVGINVKQQDAQRSGNQRMVVDQQDLHCGDFGRLCGLVGDVPAAAWPSTAADRRYEERINVFRAAARLNT